MHAVSPHSLLFVGNYMPDSRGSRAVSEDVSVQLESLGWRVLLASRKRNKVLRLADMVRTVWARRTEYDIAVIDVFSGQAFRFAEVVTSLLWLLGKPHALILHGGNLPAFAATRGDRVGAVLRRATAVIAPSRYLLERMREYRPDLQLIPNPISLGDCPFVARRKAAPRIVWLRAYHRIYNLPMAIAAVDRLRGYFPDISLTVIGPDKGDGTLAEATEEVKRRGLQAHVHLMGPVPKEEVPRYLRQADIFLNTTNFDNTPVSVLEAMACGLCVVSTNVGGIPYLLDHELDSLLVPPDDVDECVNAVARILREEGLAARLSSGARRKAESHDWSRVLPEWQNVLRGVIPARFTQQPLLARLTEGH